MIHRSMKRCRKSLSRVLPIYTAKGMSRENLLFARKGCEANGVKGEKKLINQ